MGGSLDVTVGENRTEIGGDVLSEFGPQMVALVADVARHPKFPESELARLKSDRERQLSIALSQPQPLAQEKFRAVLYGDHPVRAPLPDRGDAPGVHDRRRPRLLRQELRRGARAPLRRRPLRRRRRRGGDPEGLRGLEAGNAARALPPAAARANAPSTSWTGRERCSRRSTSACPSSIPRKPDWDTLFLMNVLLGGSFSSRITSNIREQKGYTYSPSSPALEPVPRRLLGRDRRRHDERDRAGDQGDPRRDRPPAGASRRPTQELKGFQNYRAGVFVLQNSSRAGIIGQLEFVDLHGLPADYLNGYVARVYAVTPQQVQQAAKKYLQDDKATIVVVGDKKVIEEQIKEFGPVK